MVKERRSLLVLILAATFAAQSARGSVAGDPSQPDQSAAPDTEKPHVYAAPEFERLALFVGPWNVREKHFDETGQVIARVKGTEEVTWLLDRHAIRRVYRTGKDSSTYEAIGTLTWDDVKKRYVGAWFDNVSTTGPRTAVGEWQADTKTMVFTLTGTGVDGLTRTYRVIDRFLDPEHRSGTIFEIKGDQVIKKMEVTYERAVPCPGRVRPITGGYG